jgi:Ca2+-transporting ATPase
MPADELRALVFFTLVVVIFALIFANRSFTSSFGAAIGGLKLPMMAVLAVVAVVLGLSVTWPVMKEIFGFGPLHPDDLGFTLGTGIAVLVVLELVKPLWRERKNPSVQPIP